MAERSLVTNLPDDILVTVFLNTISTRDELYRGSREVLGTGCIEKYTPWILQQVCRRWRRLIKSTHRLWSRLAIEDMGLDKIATILPPTGHINMSFCGDSSKLPSAKKTEKYEIIQAYLPRAESVVIHSLLEDDMTRLSKLPSTSFSSLRRITFSLSRSYGEEGRIASQFADLVERIGRSADNLCCLSIIGGAIYGDLLQRQIPWGALDVLTLKPDYCGDAIPGVAFALLRNVLSQCENLRECTLSLKLDNVLGRDNSISLPKLRRLSIRFRDPHILRLFYLPALCDLQIETIPIDDPSILPNTIEHLTAMINQSSCNLQHFDEEIRGNAHRHGLDVPKIEEALMSFFHLIPTVKEMHVYAIHLFAEALDCIGKGSLCPKVKILDFPTDLTTEGAIFHLSPRLGKKSSEKAPFTILSRLRVRSKTSPLNYRDAHKLSREYLDLYGIDLECFY